MLRATANLRVGAIVEAFARVSREDFLGPAPWQIGQAQPFDPAVPYRTMLDAGFEDIYQDVVVAFVNPSTTTPEIILCSEQ